MPSPELSRIRFRRAVTLMLMTLVLPGSAQLAAGNKKTGRIAMRVVFGLLAALILVVLIGLISNTFVFWLASNTFLLGLFRYLLMALACGWAYLIVDAWRLGDPMTMQRQQRLAMTGLNGVLCFSVAGSLLFASHVVTVQKNFLTTMFGASKVSAAHQGRYNVLLLGGDSGSTRWGLRPDSLTVASIDADTGKTVLFGLPRNMTNFTFAKGSIMAEQFPKGYNCGPTCELNSLVTWANNHKALFKGYAHPGLEATKEAVEGITGLKLNYYVMVNLAGFKDLVDAVGGVKLHVRAPIPKGAIGETNISYIKPGYRTLNGVDTLWFARSRRDADDYSRMARQKCVMDAMLHQLSPKQVVLKFSAIEKASTAMVKTDLPGNEVDRFMQLALKARQQPIRTVSFVPPMIKTYDPDMAKIHRMVANAINPKKKVKKTVRAATTAGGSYGNIHQGYTANDTTDLGNAC